MTYCGATATSSTPAETAIGALVEHGVDFLRIELLLAALQDARDLELP
jgi:hypothetical protein